ncbi:MAG: EAL domain-containing protein [Rhodothalassiaceae bacterium]
MLPLLKAPTVPDGETAPLRVLLWAESTSAAVDIAGLLTAAGFTSFATDSSRVVGVFAEDVEALARTLGEGMTLECQRQTKALVFTEAAPRLADFARIDTVESFVKHHSTRWLAELISEGRYKSLMQPIVNASDGAVHGYEFLLRGLKRDGGMVPPLEMFLAAEGALAARLDAAARDSAVRTAAQFGIRERLFINVLPASVSIAQSSFADTLDLIEAADIDPGHVVFEIVESEAVDDIDKLAGVIDFCRSAGYRIALDDFGSGFNNLTMLIGLKPDYIKLDKSLVSRIRKEPPIWNITANMVDAAKQSDVMVIAEGVEDEKTASLLRSMGTDYMQGYLFGRPADAPLSGNASVDS